MDTKRMIIWVVVGAVVFGGAGYIVGSKRTSGAQDARQFVTGGNFRAGAAGQGSARGEGFVGGEIIARDDTSITVKSQNGSTRIVLLAESSQITKSANGSAADLSNGTNVIVTGEQNADGSMTAQTVQIRPAGASTAGQRVSQ